MTLRFFHCSSCGHKMRVAHDHCGSCYHTKPFWQTPFVFWGSVVFGSLCLFVTMAAGLVPPLPAAKLANQDKPDHAKRPASADLAEARAANIAAIVRFPAEPALTAQQLDHSDKAPRVRRQPRFANRQPQTAPAARRELRAEI
ncbi:hypothetical protein KUV73_04315 [Mameliella alba]|nr:hypothetical protein [Mameliella alba]MBY6169208.1 hypothetical protein [Mameliella alba]MBY6173571.1 hypothetical protein [Mameliella alba]